MRRFLTGIVTPILTFALGLWSAIRLMLDLLGRADTIRSFASSDGIGHRALAWLLATPWYAPAVLALCVVAFWAYLAHQAFITDQAGTHGQAKPFALERREANTESAPEISKTTHGKEDASIKRKTALIKGGRRIVYVFMHEDPKNIHDLMFKSRLESSNIYYELEQYVSKSFKDKLAFLGRGVFLNAPGDTMPVVARAFLDELSRLEQEWGLVIAPPTSSLPSPAPPVSPPKT